MINGCTFDIETSALQAVGSGFVLCAVVKPVDGKAKTFRYDAYNDEPGMEVTMLKELYQFLGQHSVWIGHNIERFDFNYLKTRAMILGLEFPYRPFLYDTMKAYRRAGFLSRPNGLGKPSAGLGVVGDILGVTTKENAKTSIGQEREHWKAIWNKGTERADAMNHIVDHCQRDVKLNEAVFEKLWPNDFNVNLRRV